MTNPDNAGGLVWYVCTSCLLMVQLPSDTPTLGRCQCSPKGWSLRRAKLPKGYELCRAAPAGGVPEWIREEFVGMRDRMNAISDKCAARLAELVSAPAGSGEDSLFTPAEHLAACREDWQRVCDALGADGRHMDPPDVLAAIALLRKLQQGAE